MHIPTFKCIKSHAQEIPYLSPKCYQIHIFTDVRQSVCCGWMCVWALWKIKWLHLREANEKCEFFKIHEYSHTHS